MSEFEEKWLEDEFKLAEKLKYNFCDSSGKETDPSKAADIIYQIGSIYQKRSPHKLSLIKSVGLYNAAIARSPSNVSKITSELSELCYHILKKAKAKDQSADLIKEAKKLKTRINELRNNVRVFLKNSLGKIPIKCRNLQELKTNKILAMQQINKRITNKYQQIMADLSQYCQDVMGNPPCEYAVVGMGSLARNETTPYSDFEHIILLFDHYNYKAHLNYFRWYSVIFHIVLLNLQETIIPGLNIQSLNDTNSRLGDWYYDAHTSRGISFDGMMPHACKFPLGRQQHTQNKPWNTELIKPVSEMLEFLSSESDLKNGYHLADILTKTCFVFGNKTIFNLFTDGAQSYRNSKTQSEVIEEVRHQIKDDLNNFSTRFRLNNLTSLSTINIKQLVYRSTTIFIAALARIHNMKANSCFDIINEMAKSKKITENTAYKLYFAVAVACEMRLRVYTEMKSQRDNAIDLNLDCASVEKFLDIVGVANTINYFQIAYCLQCEVIKQLNFNKRHFYSDPQLINITICFAFGITGLKSNRPLTDYIDQPPKVLNISEYNFDSCIQQVEMELRFKPSLADKIRKKIPKRVLHMFSANATKPSSISKKRMRLIAQDLYTTQLYDEALEFYSRILNIYQRKPQTENRERNIAKTLYYIGNCHRELLQYQDALDVLLKALKIYQKLSANKRVNCDIGNTLSSIGVCFINSYQYKESLSFLQRALIIKTNLARNKKNIDITSTLSYIGLCYLDFKENVESMHYIKQALDIYQISAHDEKENRDVASTLNNIGYCFMEMQQHCNSLPYLKRALIIAQHLSHNQEKDCDIARTLCNIGSCHFEMQNFNESLTYFTQALHIFRNTTLDEAADGRIASTLNNIGTCHMLLHQYELSLAFFTQAIKIKYNVPLSIERSQDMANTNKNIGLCLMQNQRYSEALNNLIEAFSFYKKLPFNDQNVHQAKTVRCFINECLVRLG